VVVIVVGESAGEAGGELQVVTIGDGTLGPSAQDLPVHVLVGGIAVTQGVGHGSSSSSLHIG
jgi:hypothetical protein